MASLFPFVSEVGWARMTKCRGGRAGQGRAFAFAVVEATRDLGRTRCRCRRHGAGGGGRAAVSLGMRKNKPRVAPATGCAAGYFFSSQLAKLFWADWMIVHAANKKVGYFTGRRRVLQSRERLRAFSAGKMDACTCTVFSQAGSAETGSCAWLLGSGSGGGGERRCVCVCV